MSNLKMKCVTPRVVHRTGRDEGKLRLDMNDLDVPDPDQATKRALVRILPKLRRFCLALTATPADADDLCQSTLERAITRLEQWTPGTRLDSWLYRMAQNLHRNTLRDRSNRLRLLETEAASTLLSEGDHTSPPSDEASEVRRHVLALDTEQRKVLILIGVEGYSYKECADILDLPVTTVTNRLFQARMSLRQAMEPDINDGLASSTRRSSR